MHRGARVLTEHEIRAFYETGFVVREGVFGPAEVAAIRRAFGRLERMATTLGTTGMYRGSQFVLGPRPDRDAVGIQRIVWCGAAENTLSEYGKDPRLLAIAGQVLGTTKMNQLINQAHFKLPGDGVEFPWHQDSTHRRYGRRCWIDANGRGSYVQMVIALDDVTEANGPLELISGSCKQGHVGLPDGELPADLKDRRPIVATMRAGSVLLFGPYTYHRSTPNKSTRPRRVFINGFAFPGANTRIYPGEGAGRLVVVA